jgi:hypothetical protein
LSPVVQADERFGRVCDFVIRAISEINARLRIEAKGRRAVQIRIVIDGVVVTRILGHDGVPERQRVTTLATLEEAERVAKIAVRPATPLKEESAIPLGWKTHVEPNRVAL